MRLNTWICEGCSAGWQSYEEKELCRYCKQPAIIRGFYYVMDLPK